jgi:hypothetical protein
MKSIPVSAGPAPWHVAGLAPDATGFPVHALAAAKRAGSKRLAVADA